MPSLDKSMSTLKELADNSSVFLFLQSHGAGGTKFIATVLLRHFEVTKIDFLNEHGVSLSILLVFMECKKIK